jgi:hypothetical protein
LTKLTTLPGEALRELQLKSGLTQRQFARQYGISYNTLHSKICNAQQREVRNFGREYLKPSPYPVFDKPLEMDGDALILPDPEFPFHHAPFLNNVLSLAEAWGIRQCIIAGDVLHFNSISRWEPSWTVPAKGGLSEADEADFMERVKKLPAKYQGEMMSWIADREEEAGDTRSVSEEVGIARKCLVRLGELFDRVDYIIGNHDGRLLSALDSPLFAGALLDMIGLHDPKWRIAPYYYSILHSGGETWRIEHPKSAAQNTAVSLASKYLCHIAMGHSHSLSHLSDASGNFHAIQMGCCVDESRLPYAAQRSTSGKAHMLGALIIRNGFPYLLRERIDWELLSKLV